MDLEENLQMIYTALSPSELILSILSGSRNGGMSISGSIGKRWFGSRFRTPDADFQSSDLVNFAITS